LHFITRIALATAIILYLRLMPSVVLRRGGWRVLGKPLRLRTKPVWLRILLLEFPACQLLMRLIMVILVSDRVLLLHAMRITVSRILPLVNG
jgi:hypothetical protein